MDYLLSKAKKSTIANNNQKVQNLDVEKNICFLDLLGQVLIRSIWIQGTQGMVLDKIDACRQRIQDYCKE